MLLVVTLVVVARRWTAKCSTLGHTGDQNLLHYTLTTATSCSSTGNNDEFLNVTISTHLESELHKGRILA